MELPDIELSFWPILFLVAGGQAVFFSILLLTRNKEARMNNLYLSLFLLLFGYMLFFHFCWWTHFNYHFPSVFLTNLPIYYCFSPLLLLYFDSFRKKPQLQKYAWLHFIPAALLLFFLLPFYFQSGVEKVAIMKGAAEFPTFPYSNWIWEMRSYKFFGFQMLVYLIWKIWLLQKIKKEDKLEGLEPALNQIRNRWFIVLALLYLAFVLSFLSYFLISDLPFFTNTHDFIISGIMTISIYIIGYLGYQRPAIFTGELLPKIFNSNKYASSSLTPSAVQSIQKKLIQIIETEKIYRDNELKIGILAQTLQVNSHQLSQVINDQFGKTFNQFINDFRITEAQQLLESPMHQKTFINQIAFQVGFNNKTTFNAAFKKKTGVSPTQYRQQFYKNLKP